MVNTFEFLEDDLSAPNFEAAFQRHYALEVTQFESLWHNSLERTASIAMAPICESPPNGATNVSPGVQKLTITFNTMMNRILLLFVSNYRGFFNMWFGAQL